MEQNTTNPNEKNELKNAAPKKSTKSDNDKENKSSFADYKAEFKKIVWPAKDIVARKTVTVIVTSILIGVVIFCMDTVYQTGLDALLNLLV